MATIEDILLYQRRERGFARLSDLILLSYRLSKIN